VFNYFPAKEDLFYSRLEAFGERLAAAVSARPPGEPVLSAFRRAMLAEDSLLTRVEAGDAEALDLLRTVNRVIAASPGLRAREQEALNHAASNLAALLAAETGASDAGLGPYVVANAMIGVHRALLDYVRRQAASGDDLTGLAAEVRQLTIDALALLGRVWAATPRSPPPRCAQIAPRGPPPGPRERGKRYLGRARLVTGDCLPWR
jgi:AcrR family transcriptional regulator